MGTVGPPLFPVLLPPYMYIIKVETCLFHFFSWLDPLIWVGYKRELTHEDLYATPESIKSQHLLKHFNKLVSL